MGHIVSRQPWGTVDLNTTDGRVFVQQDWLYNWTVQPPLLPWTLQEKRKFHNTADRQIWASWSNRVRLQVAGGTDFVRRFRGSGVGINFDIHWVTSGGHWNVTVRKIPVGGHLTSNVRFGSRQIELDTEDFGAHSACTSAAVPVCRDGFRTIPHEFGHTIAADDEYTATSPNLADTRSIMNVGTQLRPRHLQLVIDTLNTMVAGVTFSMR